MNIKQVIILRTKYPDGKGGTFSPRKGKLVAQGAHASMKIFFDRITSREIDKEDESTAYFTFIGSLEMKEWIEGDFKKIVVGCNSEDTLIMCYNKAQEMEIPCALIEDNGLTEFKGVKTKTALAIGPADSDKIDKITKELKLL